MSNGTRENGGGNGRRDGAASEGPTKKVAVIGAGVAGLGTCYVGVGVSVRRFGENPNMNCTLSEQQESTETDQYHKFTNFVEIVSRSKGRVT